ncbi:unnamed protein product [Lepeophtheirus salmonis]|uniref:(salmon louse) hypothetical protein n=1 Tax=Lepeophtheirus salmonis TaxID=72036 RepID=A0A7R8D4P6_LEPSM|nr:unnamed protein product [Lepeophtheirus salmonis]CAF3027899.1 unnamed protein product [Lepeophtheirus salmonis]
MDEASHLLAKIKSSALLNTREVLCQMTDITKRICSSSKLLSRLTRKNIDLHGSQDTYNEELRQSLQLSELPSLDPGLRSRKLSDTQRRYLIVKRPYQLKLKNSPRTIQFRHKNNNNFLFYGTTSFR